MSNTSTMSNAARDVSKEARDAMKASGKAVSQAGDDIQADLESLRDDVAHLTIQLAEILTQRGTAALRKAKSSVNDVLSDAEAKGRDALDALEDSLKTRPYTSLLIAAGLGFLIGATWRR